MIIIISFFAALLLTIIIELTAALLIGYRKRNEIITIILINVITNPALNYLLFVNRTLSLFEISIFVILFLELLVVLIEWRLLVFALKEKSNKLLALSIVINFCSYIIGFYLF